MKDELKGKAMINDIAEFCAQHGACSEGKEWALANCFDMADAWEKLQPDWLVWVATQPSVLPDKELRLFACWCVRQVWHLLTDERSRHAVEVAERYADGLATEDELAAAWAAAGAAWEAVWVAGAAAWAARAAAGVTAAAAGEAAGVTAWAATGAARAAAWVAAGVTAGVTVQAAQARWLRDRGNPFRVVMNT